ncbi:MAG: nuclear transport factor 2 family protein [Chloroflexota bacterium]|nr:nuclear transport factor 2 family protein [Chloroflexota bacterium]
MIVAPGTSVALTPDPNSKIKIVITTPMQHFYEEHVTLLDARDFEGLVRTHYQPDAQVMSNDYQVRGHDELIRHFAKYTGLMAYLQVISTDKWVEGDSTFAFEATARTQWGVGRVHDAFWLRDGLIVRHFTGAIPATRFLR